MSTRIGINRQLQELVMKALQRVRKEWDVKRVEMDRLNELREHLDKREKMLEKELEDDSP